MILIELENMKVYNKMHSYLLRYTKADMDMEIQRVARELYKALSGLNEEFEDVSSFLFLYPLNKWGIFTSFCVKKLNLYY